MELTVLKGKENPNFMKADAMVIFHTERPEKHVFWSLILSHKQNSPWDKRLLYYFMMKLMKSYQILRQRYNRSLKVEHSVVSSALN